MIPATRSTFVVVMVTAPDQEVARKLARAALDPRLVACANILPALESHYWWQDKLETASEALIVFKTVREKLKALEQVIREHHPYETPEFLVLDVGSGSQKYLDWISSVVNR